eukprot:TRINITY_DN50069_c0_g1_i1.p1 TRINITY_DN50069_c0_g1~~TRINITY_DN50069_c0_g1_i1.p1  ORF type:complete len:388 (-),score=42.48 TRINITY_DN50069_c0_g1_i1:21-1184(-)
MAALVSVVERELPDERELQILRKMRREAGVDGPSCESAPDVMGNLRAMRFLRGRSCDVAVASEMFQNMLTWRAQETRFNVDDLRKRVVGFSIEEFQKYYAAKPERPFLPAAFLGRSRTGAVVVYCKVGSWDLGEAMLKCGEVCVLESEVEKLEWIMWNFHKICVEERRVPYLLVLADAAGASFSQVRGKQREALKAIVQNLGNNYIDAVELTLVYNASLAFRALWAIVSTFLTERQKSKLRVFGDPNEATTRALLHAAVAPEVLPKCLGGTAVVDIWGSMARESAEASPSRTKLKNRKQSSSTFSSWISCCVSRHADRDEVTFADPLHGSGMHVPSLDRVCGEEEVTDANATMQTQVSIHSVWSTSIILFFAFIFAVWCLRVDAGPK